jgi:hypothetical protein
VLDLCDDFMCGLNRDDGLASGPIIWALQQAGIDRGRFSTLCFGDRARSPEGGRAPAPTSRQAPVIRFRIFQPVSS